MYLVLLGTAYKLIVSKNLPHLNRGKPQKAFGFDSNLSTKIILKDFCQLIIGNNKRAVNLDSLTYTNFKGTSQKQGGRPTWTFHVDIKGTFPQRVGIYEHELLSLTMGQDIIPQVNSLIKS